MSKLNQLLNIEVGTFKRQGNKLILELNHNQFRYDQLSELNELKQADAKFLQLVNVVEQDQKVVLTYTLPDKVRSLKDLPHENKAIRSAIAKESWRNMWLTIASITLRWTLPTYGITPCNMFGTPTGPMNLCLMMTNIAI